MGLDMFEDQLNETKQGPQWWEVKCDIDRTSQALPRSTDFTECERLSLEGSKQVNDML